jgi:hypothetical protein
MNHDANNDHHANIAEADEKIRTILSEHNLSGLILLIDKAERNYPVGRSVILRDWTGLATTDSNKLLFLEERTKTLQQFNYTSGFLCTLSEYGRIVANTFASAQKVWMTRIFHLKLRRG